jgi:hypothetical protein
LRVLIMTAVEGHVRAERLKHDQPRPCIE